MRRFKTFHNWLILALGVVIAASVLPLNLSGGIGRIAAYDGGSNEVTSGVWPRALASDGTNLWIANGFDDTVQRYSEDTPPKKVGEPIKVGAMPSAMAWDSVQQKMWVAGYNDLSLTVIDQNGKATPAFASLIGKPVAMVFAGTFLWVVVQAKTGKVIKINTAALKQEKSVDVGNLPTAIAASTDGKRLWVTNGDDDTVTPIDITKDGGSALDLFKDSIPAFPIDITFDGAFLWIGNYEGKIVKVDALSGAATDTKLDLPGRPVGVFYLNGHVWIANAHEQSITDVDSQGAGLNGLEARKSMTNHDTSYAGTVLATAKFVYMADWLNDRVIRLAAPAIIAVRPTTLPTLTPIPPTATATPPPCNGNPKFPPQFKPGDTGQVVTDADKRAVIVHKDSPSDDPKTKIGALLPGQKFKVIEGPFVNANPDPKAVKVCFYKVQGLDDASALAGYITEGGYPDSQPKEAHYFIAPVK